MAKRAGERGAAFVLAVLLLAAGIGAVFAVELAGLSASARRDRASDRALAQAREALIAYAADRPINAAVGPGYLPCPDLDGDGWAEATCGSQNGDSGQAERLGRLPWKTLGIADLRDGYGERLWYAVSSKYKGLLNCAVSRACLDMTPDTALGTITLREASGALLHDGTIAEPHRADAGGALAVVIAPGAPLARADGHRQERHCASGDCDAALRCLTEPPQRAARCDPLNYLDAAPLARLGLEDNAAFRDRNDAAGRAANRDGFIRGPVALDDGRIAVNDRIVAIAYRDVMPRVMARVALEVSQCLRAYAERPENGARYPWPAPPCAQALADPGAAWRDQAGVLFGRVPDTPFAASAASGRLERWSAEACHIAVDDGATAGHAGNSWWTPWKPYVFYALSRGFAPDSARPACDASAPCVELVDAAGRVVASEKRFAILVAGAALARDGFVQDRSGAKIADPRQWLEDGNARLEGAAACPAGPPAFACEASGTCGRVTVAAAGRGFNDVVVAP